MVNKSVVVCDKPAITSINMGGPSAPEGTLEELSLEELSIKYTVQTRPARAVQKALQAQAGDAWM